MKFELLKKRKLEIGLSLLIGLSLFWGCNNDLAPINQSQAFPPNLNAPSVFESFSPDSGGIGTQLIIRGQNFGSDPSYLKVTVNNKEAAIEHLTISFTLLFQLVRIPGMYVCL